MNKHTSLTKEWWDSFLNISDPRKDYGDAFVWTKQELKLKEQIKLKQQLKTLTNDQRI